MANWVTINTVYIGCYTIYIQSSPSVFVILFSGKISTASLEAPNRTKGCDVVLSLKKKKVLWAVYIKF